MPGNNRSVRVALSVVGLVFVVLSLILSFVMPGTWWNWALLGVSLVIVILARRVS